MWEAVEGKECKMGIGGGQAVASGGISGGAFSLGFLQVPHAYERSEKVGQ